MIPRGSTQSTHVAPFIITTLANRHTSWSIIMADRTAFTNKHASRSTCTTMTFTYTCRHTSRSTIMADRTAFPNRHPRTWAAAVTAAHRTTAPIPFSQGTNLEIDLELGNNINMEDERRVSGCYKAMISIGGSRWLYTYIGIIDLKSALFLIITTRQKCI